jgi:hypothetical protein
MLKYQVYYMHCMCAKGYIYKESSTKLRKCSPPVISNDHNALVQSKTCKVPV